MPGFSKKMSIRQDFCFRPEEYIILGDCEIDNPPLIHTSLYKLSEANWMLDVDVCHVHTPNMVKIAYIFRHPSKSTNRIKLDYWIDNYAFNRINEENIIIEYDRVISSSPLAWIINLHNFLHGKLVPDNKPSIKIHNKGGNNEIQYIDISVSNPQKPVTLDDLISQFSEEEIVKAINDKRYATLDTSVPNNRIDPANIEDVIDNIIPFPAVYTKPLNPKIQELLAA